MHPNEDENDPDPHEVLLPGTLAQLHKEHAIDRDAVAQLHKQPVGGGRGATAQDATVNGARKLTPLLVCTAPSHQVQRGKIGSYEWPFSKPGLSWQNRGKVQNGTGLLTGLFFCVLCSAEQSMAEAGKRPTLVKEQARLWHR